MKSQKRFVNRPIWVCSLLAIALAGCDITVGPSLRGSGVAKTETREVAPFSEIEVGSAIRLDATIGPANSLVVTSDDNILPHVTTVVADDRLKVYVDTSYSTELGVEVKVTVPALRSLHGSGASQTTLAGLAEDQFHLDLSGASGCQLTGEADLMNVQLSGASHGTIAGSAKRLTVECSGASHLDAAGLEAERDDASKMTLSGITGEHFRLDLSGASGCRLTGDADLIELTLSGASHGMIAGTSKRLTVNCSGASHLDATGLTAKIVTAELTGGSTGHVNAIEELTAEASGASSLRYAGQPSKLDKRHERRLDS